MIDYQFGLPGDVPLAADPDGDGKDDLLVWRPATGTWHAYISGSGATSEHQWGLAGDIAV